MTSIAIVNMAWQMGGNNALIASAVQGADVVLACEALNDGGKKPAYLRDILPDGWETNQLTGSTARAGSAVCWNTATIEHRGSSLIRLSGPGHNVRERYLSAAYLRNKHTGDSRRYGACHAPLQSTGQKQNFYDVLERWLRGHPNAIVGGDGNWPPRRIESAIRRKTIGTEVIFLTLPTDLPITATSSEQHPNSDHPIYRVTTGR